MPRVRVYNGPGYYGHGHYHGHRNHQADTGVFLMFAGLLLGSPFLFILGYFEYMTAPMLIATSSTAFLGLSTLSLSALIVYGSIGVAYMFSGARECYSSEHGPLDLLKSRLTNGGLFNTIGAVLWSPFLLVGGVAGVAAKAVVNVFNSKPSTKNNSSNPRNDLFDDEDTDEENDLLSSSHSNHSSHSHHSNHSSDEHSSDYSSDEEDNFESPREKKDESPSQWSTEGHVEPVQPLSADFRLPISKSQENLSSYNKMASGLNFSTVPKDDSSVGYVPVPDTNLLRKSLPTVSAQDQVVQHEEVPGLK
ncbi:hypothetical protein [Legionella saoudiensis]|uniref:hypothetical protein n=1 Tax=Legionella saoudiensis TaxID=1750561 RepID=UPI000730ED06|nr:hypothetical protein [Legionella saoudiensis]